VTSREVRDAAQVFVDEASAIISLLWRRSASQSWAASSETKMAYDETLRSSLSERSFGSS